MSGILTIIQARMGSERLPGKVLMDICGKPMLQWVIEAAPEPKVVAIAAEPDGQQLANLCAELGVYYSFGSPEDVLGRFWNAVDELQVTECETDVGWILRLTADCPMLTREILETFIELCERASHAGDRYTIYTNRPHDPDGYDMELFSVKALGLAHQHATAPHDREHVTPWMYRHLSVVRFSVLGRPVGPERAEEKVSVDTAEDWEKVRRLMRCQTTTPTG